MNINLILKKGVAVGIIVLFLCANVSTGITKEMDDFDSVLPITVTDKNELDKTVSITVSIYGTTGIETRSIEVALKDAVSIFELFTDLRDSMTADPNSGNAQQLQHQFFDLLQQNDAIPEGVSSEELLSLMQPPALPLKHLPCSILPFQNKASEWFCNFATFGEGAAFPIIILPRFIPIILTPIPRVFIYWSTEKGLTSVGGLLSGTGFLAGGQQKGIALGFWGIGFSIFLPPVRSYGIFGYALYTRVAAEQFEFYPPNNPPRVTQTDPADGQQFVPLSTKELRFAIEDKDKDPISYSVTTEPDIGSDSGGLKPDGTYSVAVSGLESLTTYSWTIELTDGMDITKKTLTFTTEPVAPVISNPLPKDNAEFISVETMSLSFDLMDHQGDVMDWTVETQPDIGSGAATGVKDGRCMVAINGLDYFTSYKWFVNVTDGEHWTRKTFVFKTVAEHTLAIEPTDDATIMENHPNDPTGHSLEIVLRSGSGWEWDILIKFNLSAIPSNVTIQYASLQAYYYRYHDGNPSGHQVNIYRIMSDWNEETVTWATRPSYSSEVSSFTWVPSTIDKWMIWNVTDDVTVFYNNGTLNYGWRMVDISGGYQCTYLRSKEYSDFHPVLIIGYEP
jgi:hypothetical protein